MNIPDTSETRVGVQANGLSAARTPRLAWITSTVAIILFAAFMLNVYGYVMAPPGYQFSGLVYNWQDGNSYLAKLREGVRGEWLYTVPFNAEKGAATLLYPHYIFMGHLARWLSAEPVIIFNAARFLAALVLLLSLYRFMGRLFAVESERRFAFVLAATGSGLGWLAVTTGKLLPDMWQAEIFPFLSILSNPHFTLAIAAMLWALEIVALPEAQSNANANKQFAWLLSGTMLMAFLQPYSLVIVIVITAAWATVSFARQRSEWRKTLLQLIGMGAVSAPIVLYTQWAVLNVPALVAWDKQNLTPAAPIWDYALALGIVLPLAAVGAVRAVRRRSDTDLVPLIWCGVTLVLMFVPFYGQQRRFAVGLFIPVSALAVQGLVSIHRLNVPLIRLTLIGTSVLTNIILLLLAYTAMLQPAPYLYFTTGEWNALLYLRANAPQDAVVVTSPDMGLYIPAWAGQRVIYGHPHETAQAKTHADMVTAFYSGTLANPDTFLAPVDYVLLGPRERLIGQPPLSPSFQAVFEDHDVILYQKRR